MSCDNKFRSAMTLKAWKPQVPLSVPQADREARPRRLHDRRDLVMPDLPKVL